MDSAVGNQSINQEVYQATKNVFVDRKAKFRKPKLVKKTVDSHAGRDASVRRLINQHGPARVYQTVLKLLSHRVYESSQVAHSHFPDLFKPSEAQSEARFHLEVEAARSEQAAVEGVIQSDLVDTQGGLEEKETSLSLHDWFGKYSTGNQTKTPQLFPVYLPFPVELLFMERLQKYLELACYDYGIGILPNIMQRYGWDCPESVELNKWTQIFKREGIVEWTSSEIFSDELLQSIASIRHKAVHRLRTSSTGLERLLVDAETFTVALGNPVLVKAVRQLRSNAELVLTELRQNKQFLEGQLETTQAEIAKERAKLDRKEQEAVDHMTKEDEKYKELAGEKLEKVLSLTNCLSWKQNGEEALANGLSSIGDEDVEEDDEKDDEKDSKEEEDDENCSDDDMDIFEDC